MDDLELPSPDDPEGADALVRLVNSQIATDAHRWIIHHPGDRPLDDAAVGPRTAWADELVEVIGDGQTRREIYMHRRLPVQDVEEDRDSTT